MLIANPAVTVILMLSDAVPPLPSLAAMVRLNDPTWLTTRRECEYSRAGIERSICRQRRNGVDQRIIVQIAGADGELKSASDCYCSVANNESTGGWFGLVTVILTLAELSTKPSLTVS